MKTVIEVEVKDVEVDEEYYSFKYRISVNGKPRKWERYDGDYQNGQSAKQWKKEVENRYAVECAMQDFRLY